MLRLAIAASSKRTNVHLSTSSLQNIFHYGQNHLACNNNIREGYAKGLVTSAQKRALNESQIEGIAEAKTPLKAPPGGSNSAGSSGGGSGASEGGGNGMIGGIIAVLAVGGAVAAYQQDLLPTSITGKTTEDTSTSTSSLTTKEEISAIKEEETPIPTPSESAVDDNSLSTEQTESTSNLTDEESTSNLTEEETTSAIPNRVTLQDMALTFPPKVDRPTPVIPPVQHSSNGHRVPVDLGLSSSSKQTDVKEGKDDTANDLPTKAIEAAKELQSSSLVDSSSDLHKAFLLLRKDLDQSYLDELDSLSNSELKIRLIRIVNDMADRGRFEAVKWKEMMDLKEKEISDKYLAILQQQRHEFEDLLSKRLREQEDALQRQTTNLLHQKDESIQSVLNASASTLNAEHEADLTSKLQQLEKELLLKKESEYQEALAAEKEKYVTELQEHVQQIQDLTTTLRNLEDVATASATFQSSSQRAHTISAAALALSNKLDTSAPLAVELATLRAVAGTSQNTVIQSTLEQIPQSAESNGVPTLPMLQNRFEHVWDMAQTALLVPSDGISLGGQLLGKVFSSLKYTAPVSDEDSIEGLSSSDDPEKILSLAKYNVERGELDKAVSLLNKLDQKTQVGFTVKDWMNDAKDRVILEKALKVIKMECALLNENMAKE